MILVAHLINVAAADDKPPQFKITTKRENDQVDVQLEQAKAVLSIRSPFGISQALVERVGEQWPELVVLRLHLTGLEKFQVVAGKTSLSASVSSVNATPRVRVWQADHEDTPLDSDHPLWLNLRQLDSAGKPTREIPLRDGCFEIALPKALFKDNPKSFTLNWIDFYR